MREAFEKWIRVNRPSFSLVKYGSERYCDWNTEMSWRAWKAAWECKGRLDFGELS